MKHLYLSYASKDEDYGNHLKQLLKPLATDYGFTTWSKQDTSAGLQWQHEMAAHLKQAMLFVPLVSADYLASDRCTAEMNAAVQLQRQGLQIVCILVRPTLLTASPWGQVPYLPAPGKPIANWRKRDQAWLRVQQGILDALRLYN